MKNLQHELSCRRNYTQQCPGWDHQLWLEVNLSSLFYLDVDLLEDEDTLHGKTDIARGAILYEHGGVYIDADTLWVNNHCLNDVLELSSTTGFFAAIEPTDQVGGCQNHVANGVIGAVQHHPIIKEYMQVQQVFQTSKGASASAWERLGPLALSAALQSATNTNCTGQTYSWDDRPSSVVAQVALATILHPLYFYPEPWHGVTQETAKNFSSIYSTIAEKHPKAIMFQLGLTTNALNLDGL